MSSSRFIYSCCCLLSSLHAWCSCFMHIQAAIICFDPSMHANSFYVHTTARYLFWSLYAYYPYFMHIQLFCTFRSPVHVCHLCFMHVHLVSYLPRFQSIYIFGHDWWIDANICLMGSFILINVCTIKFIIPWWSRTWFVWRLVFSTDSWSYPINFPIPLREEHVCFLILL